MARTWFSEGLSGSIAGDIQSNLLRQGFFAGSHDKFLDGDFGNNTATAITQLQAARSLPQTGSVDDATWQQLTVNPIPTLFERCLGLTASFEGNGFTLIEGNFDGAGLTWGIIGFTLSNNEIQGLLEEVEQVAPGTLVRVMGTALAQEWATETAKPIDQQVAWADAMSMGASKTGLPSEWVDAFARLGAEPVVQRLQMHHAYDSYFVPCVSTANSLQLTTELGIALCFDIHVQNGTSRVKAVADLLNAGPAATELLQRQALAQAVASHVDPAWRNDVLLRKMTIATGGGTVHRRVLALASWGLDEFPAA